MSSIQDSESANFRGEHLKNFKIRIDVHLKISLTRGHTLDCVIYKHVERVQAT